MPAKYFQVLEKYVCRQNARRISFSESKTSSSALPAEEFRVNEEETK